MKKVLLMLVAGAFLSTTMISCAKKCGTCPAIGNVQICEKDSQAAYDAAKTTCGSAWVD